jgi:micrococcal nuclease
MRVRIAMLLLAASGSTVACGRGHDAPRGGVSVDDPSVGIVRTVVDGDTLDIEINGRTERVRLIGVDTPETKKPDEPVECYGPEASAYTSHLLPSGTAVRLVRDVVPRDDYGRLLAYVFREPDGLFVNDALLRNGYARPLTIAPNDTYRPILSVSSSSSRTDGVGLWSHCRD